MSEAAARHDFQYSSMRHQVETAVSGMWLFLATEMMFFGPLFLAWIFSRHADSIAFDAGAKQTDLFIGTLNTVLLITSSLAYSFGVAFIEVGRRRALILCLIIAWLLGGAFLILKFAVEWPLDFEKGLFPGPDFAFSPQERNGAQLFFVFYFFSTAIHGLHVIVGLGLVGWIILRAPDFTSSRHTAILVVGLYWSFVDMVWIILYPLIYLIGRGP
jgi:cytochrome c oxidase subunit III